MDLAKEFLAALGGTATAVLILGSLLTWSIQNQFSRQLEAYKNILQESLARFNFIYPEDAKAVIDLFSMCVEIDEQLRAFRNYWSIERGKQPSHYGRELNDCFIQVQGKTFAIEALLRAKRLHFFEDLVFQVNGYAEMAAGVFKYDLSPNDVEHSLLRAASQLEAIERSVKMFLKGRNQE